MYRPRQTKYSGFYQKAFGRLSFSTKLVLIFLLMVVLPVYFIFNLQYAITAQGVENEIAGVMGNISKNQADEINRTFEEMDTAARELRNDIALQNILLDGCGGDSDTEYLSHIYRLYNNEYRHLILYASSAFFSRGYDAQPGFIRPHVKAYNERSGRVFGADRWLKRGYFLDGGKLYITVSDDFRDERGIAFGSFKIILDEEALYKRLLRLSSSADDYYLIDNAFFIVSSSRRILLGKPLKDEGMRALIEKGDNNRVIGGRRFTKENLKEKQWYFIKEIDMAQFEGRVVYVRGVTAAVFICVIAIMLIAGLFYSRSVSRRLKGLALAMYNNVPYSSELFSSDEAPDHFFNEGDEVDSLVRGYGRLRYQIQTLINDVYKADNERIKSRLQTLQEQINPHFLYNILDSIKSCIELGRIGEANKMVKSLSQFYRKTLSGGMEKITIRDELSIVQAYVELQKMCYGDRFDLTVEVPEQLLEFTVVKLILQPIVENAINHAFPESAERATIHISGSLWRDDIMLYVRDNGCGMLLDKLRQVRRGLESDTTTTGRGYGLRNVNARMKLHYGRGYGIVELFSSPGKGTTVAVRIPPEV